MKKYRKLGIVLICIVAVIAFVLLNFDISVTKVDETEVESETELVLDEAALVEFDTEKGLTIKMPETIEEYKSGDHSVYYFSEECMVSVKQVTFDELEEAGNGDADTTLEEYIAIVEESNSDITFSQDSYGNPAVMYSAENDDEAFAYYSTVRKGSEAFWLVNFSCMEEDKEVLYPQFEFWANTIKVN